jgi:hypothetical protein
MSSSVPINGTSECYDHTSNKKEWFFGLVRFREGP